MAYQTLYTGDLLIRVVREASLADHGADDHLGFLRQIYILSSVCRAWHGILSSYMNGHLVVVMSMGRERPLLQGLTSSALRLSPHDEMKLPVFKDSGRNNTYKIRSKYGQAALHVSSNVPQAVKRGVSRVKTIVFSVDATMDVVQALTCITRTGMNRQPWPRARSLCIRIQARHGTRATECIPHTLSAVSRAVSNHAPFLKSLSVTGSEWMHSQSALDLSRMFGENANYMQHIDVFTDLGCRSFKDLSPVLTSLSVAIPSIISPDSLALLPTHTLQRITLHEVRSRELDVLLCGIDSGHEHVVYGALRSLKICLRVGPTNASDNEDSRLLQTSPRTLKFPQLEYLYMKGIRQPVPQMLLSALASRGQCMKCLYIDRTIHGSEIFNIQHMQRLRRLHVTTPYIDNAQALLKWAFPVALPELQTIALASQVNVAGRLPRVLLLPSLRRVELCVFIDLVQVWQLVRQLPRLAFLWVMISDAEDQSAEVRLADAEGMVLRDIEGLGSPLHTLHIWSRTALCTESGEPSQIGVEFVTLLASLTSLVSFVCDTSAAGVRNMLCLLLRNHRIASRAAHLGALHIKEYGSL